MSLVPVPSEQPAANCANCGATLVADQRYCLNCGQPVSPVRLAFLDALAPDGAPAVAGAAQVAWTPAVVEDGGAGYIPVQSQGGANAWLRRNSGLLGLLTVLALVLLAGLLVGHWVSQSKAPTSQTVKIEGLGGLAGLGAANAAQGASSTGSSSSGSSSAPAPSTASTKSEAKQSEEEGKHETAKEKAPPPAPKKASTQINKLSKSTGKKHHEEIEAQGATPIETG